MSVVRPPKPAKLVTGVFLKDRDLLETLISELAEKFGPIDIISQWFPFDYTSYYEPEMGFPLFRRMLAYKNLIEQTDLAGIKNITNDIELKYSKNGKRAANIDPGYMLCERFILATGKNYTHRIYIGEGIYADLTLIYQKSGFKKLPWTYPDYYDERMVLYLKTVREKYMVDLKRDT
ncbi:MAG: DUF4416 family protein [Desulfobacterales bacterium]